jgi:hypothetical protein
LKYPQPVARDDTVLDLSDSNELGDPVRDAADGGELGDEVEEAIVDAMANLPVSILPTRV